MKRTNVFVIVLLTLGAMAFIWSRGNTNEKCKTEAKAVAENKIEENAVIIDVRTPPEYEAGHLAEAINIDVKSQEFFNKIGELDKSKQYYVYCKSGIRSSKAQQIMLSRNFKQVCNVDGGILQLQKEGATIVK